MAYTPYKRKKLEKTEQELAYEDALKNHLGAEPTYNPGEVGIMATEALKEYLDRPQFSYDINEDALYSQYADKYTKAGKKAMQDTMGQAAALTGGYGNSYAATAGQQAYQGYMQELTDKIPELQQLAYSQYQDRGQELLQKYGLLSDEEQKGYDRYLDQYGMYMDKLDYLTGRYDTERDIGWQQYTYGQNFEQGEYQFGYNANYNEGRDAVADKRYDTEWQHQLDRETIADRLSAEETDYSRGQDAIDMAMAIYKLTGDPSKLNELTGGKYSYIDVSEDTGGTVTPDYKDIGSIMETVEDYVGNKKSETAKAYLDLVVKHGAISPEDADTIAKQNGLESAYADEYTEKQMAAIDTSGWTDADWTNVIRSIALDENSPKAAEEEVLWALSEGRLGQGQASVLLDKIRSGKWE